MTQFGRVMRVDVIVGGRRTIIPGGEDGLDMAFSARLTGSVQANTAELQIYNLADGNARLFESEGVEVAIFAGYRDAGGAVQVFRGTPARDGVRDDTATETRVTAVQLRDGGTALRDVVLSENIAGRTDSDTVLRRVAAALGAAVGTFQPGRTVTYRRGWSHVGPARRALRQLARDTRSVVSITDGRLTVYPLSGERRVTQLIIAPDTSLLSARSTAEGVEVVSTMVPWVRPGDRFRVEGHALAGQYVATRVTLQGDSTSVADDFVTVLTARAA